MSCSCGPSPWPPLTRPSGTLSRVGDGGGTGRGAAGFIARPILERCVGVVGRGGPHRFTQLGHGVFELRVDIAPFTHARVGQEMLPAEPAHPALGFERFERVVVGLPDPEKRQKIRARLVEASMGSGGRFLSIRWALAGVLDAEAGGND